MNWYIGQEVVYIGDTGYGWTKGEIGIITSISRHCCSKEKTINIMHRRTPVDLECSLCDSSVEKKGDLLHVRERHFRPVADITELESILNTNQKVNAEP